MTTKSIDGPRPLDRRSRDGHGWLYELGPEPWATRVEVRLTGTAAACADSTLPPRVAAAKRSAGRSELERVASWERPPGLILITPEWIALFHANGHFSRVGQRLPEDPVRRFEALAERSRIRLEHGQGVEDVYEFDGRNRWTLRSFQGETLRREEPRQLSDAIAKLSGEREQAALDLDPSGASMLSRRQLDFAETEILRVLVDAPTHNSVDMIYAEVARRTSVPYEEVERALDTLLGRRYVEDAGRGCWQATDVGREVRRQLRKSEPAAA
ncbi:MAG TPA: hypothetical protein VFN92_03370 [Solirubrobacterales bacterium]|nr:hypothetical protein [Solirubrobacterales bacterium]